MRIRNQLMLALAGLAVFAVIIMPNANAFAESSATSRLTITSQLTNGTEIQGYFTQLTLPDSSFSTGFTPATFTLNDGETYLVCVADYLNYFFDYWLDTGSTDRVRTISINEDTALSAVYRVEDMQTDAGNAGQGEGSSGASTAAVTNTNAGSISWTYVQQLADRLSVYGGDNSKVPDLNLSGYGLPGGSEVMQYDSMYELVGSGMVVSDTMLAADMAGLEWNSLTEEQQCFLAIVLNLGIPLDENGLPA
ncbi:MAG: hypothetical protein ABI347_01065 [Nitrososphaera sp.]|jgi:hypothetical protein